MNLEEVDEAYAIRSSILSDIARKLSFAGIAIVWIFSGGTPANAESVHVPTGLRFPAVLWKVALGIDLLQYAYSTFAWGVFHRIKEKGLGVNSTKSFDAPAAINYPTLTLFWLKLAAVGTAYGITVDYLGHKLL